VSLSQRLDLLQLLGPTLVSSPPVLKQTGCYSVDQFAAISKAEDLQIG